MNHSSDSSIGSDAEHRPRLSSHSRHNNNNKSHNDNEDDADRRALGDLSEQVLCVRIEVLIQSLVATPLLNELCACVGDLHSLAQRLSRVDRVRHVMRRVGALSPQRQLALVPELCLLHVQSRSETVRWRAWRLSQPSPPSSPMGCRKACERLQSRRPGCVARARRHRQAVWFFVCDDTRLRSRWLYGGGVSTRAIAGASTVVWFPGEPALFSHGSVPQHWLLEWLAAAFGFACVERVMLCDKNLFSVRQRFLSSLHNTLYVC